MELVGQELDEQLSESVNFHAFEPMVKIAKNNGIQTIDIHKEVFLEQKDPLELFSLKMNSHYNPKGYRLVAEEILKKIKEDNY